MINVVIPTRGRPKRAAEVLEAVRETAGSPDTRVWLAVDRDDPEFDAYVALVQDPPGARYGWDPDRPYMVPLAAYETGDLVRATNTVSMRLARMRPRSIIANWGDDHVPRSYGWDREVAEALETPGIAYGDDRIHGEHLPTAPFISSEIVEALGWYALPTARHLYIDDVWKTIGQALGCLRYLPDVVIEHMHPAVQKADWDEGYERANNGGMVERDREAYEEWTARYMNLDLDAVRPVLSAA